MAVLVSVALIGVIIAFFFAWRLRSLTSRVGSFECALKRPEGQWKAGIMHYHRDLLAWYPVLSVGTRPKYTFARDQLQIVSHLAREIEGGTSTIHEVDCRNGGERLVLAADVRSVHGLVSWLESAPPGHTGEIELHHRQ